MKPQWYILDKEKKPVPASNSSEAASWLTDIEKRRVALDNIVLEDFGVAITISTVFTSMDYSSLPDEKPVLFETEVSCDDLDRSSKRYFTWQQAEAGHSKMVELLKNKAWANKWIDEAGINPTDKEMIACEIIYGLVQN